MSHLSNREFKTELFEQFARVSQALSSGKRLEILELLAQGERSVDALAQLTGMTAVNTSQHLQQLRKAGLVASRKDGLFVIYRIAGGGVVRLLMALREVAENNLAEVERLIKSFLNKKDNLEPVSANELRKLTRRGAVTVVDVRPPEEYAAGHLPGALNLPLPQLARQLHKLPANREIVAYCRGPYCLLSFDAVEMLRAKGRKARRLAEGYPEWQSAGLPVDRSAPGSDR